MKKKELELLKQYVVLIEDKIAIPYGGGYGILVRDTCVYKPIPKEQFDTLKNVLDIITQE